MKSLKKWEKYFIEGYASALQDILLELTGDNNCSKNIDPMTCDNSTMHSHAFSMKEGGSQHDVKNYKNINEIKQVLLWEVISDIQRHQFFKT